MNKISAEKYNHLVDDARKFLEGKSTKIQESMAIEMAEASKNLQFERAASLRDRIRALTNVQSSQGINPKTVNEADIVSLHMEGDQACVQVFFIRAFQNWGNKDYFPETGAGADSEEIMRTFLGQFYSNKIPPSNIFLSNEIQDRDSSFTRLSKAISADTKSSFRLRTW